MFDPVWRAVQPFQLLTATHAILFCGEGRHVDRGGNMQIVHFSEIALIGSFMCAVDYSLAIKKNPKVKKV